MANKEIKISAALDTSVFDTQVERIKQRLEKIRGPAENQSQVYNENMQRLRKEGFGFDQNAERLFRQASTQSRLEVDNFIKQTQASQDKIIGILDRRKAKLQELQKIELDSLNNEKEKEQVVKRIERVQSQIGRLNQTNSAMTKGMTDSLNARQDLLSGESDEFSYTSRATPEGGFARMLDAYGRKGMKGALARGRSMMMDDKLGAAGLGLAAVGTAVDYGVPLYKDAVTRRQQAVWQSQGSATQGFSDQANALYGNNMMGQNFFGSQRNDAIQEAIKQYESKRNLDTASLVGKGAQVGGGLITAGKGIGTVAGGLAASVIGGAGVPAIVGGAAMTVAGMGTAAHGAYTAMTDERLRSKMFDKNRYEAITAEDLANDYQANFQAQKQKDPLGNLALERYQSKSGQYLNMQRALGLDDQFMKRGGQLDTNNALGYTEAESLQAMSSVLSSGGSTRSARDVTGSLRLQRGADLTNASQIQGKLSGVLGDAAATEQAQVKILMEGVKLGLDRSEYAEEQRQFNQSIAEIVVNSGAGTAGSAASVAERASAFYNEDTIHGMNSAKSLYDLDQELTRSTSGARGAIQAAAIDKSDIFGGLNFKDKSYFANRKSEELSEDDAFIKKIAEEQGRTTEEVLKEALNIKSQTTYFTKEADTMADKIAAQVKEATKTNGMTPAEYLRSPEMERPVLELGIESSSYDQTLQGKNDRELSQFTRGQILKRMGVQDSSFDDVTTATGALSAIGARGNGRGGRLGDIVEAGEANQERAVRGEFDRNYDRIKQSAEVTANMSEKMVSAIMNFTQAFETGGSAVNDAMLKYAEDLKNAARPATSMDTPSPIAPQYRPEEDSARLFRENMNGLVPVRNFRAGGDD